MDRIFLKELTTETIIGIFDWEREVRQTIAVDLEMSADIRRAATSDRIEDTLNYKGVAKRVLAFVADSRFQLIETLAERIAELILTEFQVEWVRVTLHKPGAIRHSRDVGVMIERTRGNPLRE
jgi:dihydroneopterin aldolase